MAIAVKECPLPTAFTRSPRRAAATTSSATSSVVAGWATATGVVLAVPAQFVHVVSWSTPSLSLPAVRRHRDDRPVLVDQMDLGEPLAHLATWHGATTRGRRREGPPPPAP